MTEARLQIAGRIHHTKLRDITSLAAGDSPLDQEIRPVHAAAEGEQLLRCGYLDPLAIILAASLFLLLPPARAGAQDPPADPSANPDPAGAPPPPATPPPGKKSSAKSQKDSATQNAPDQPTWDPLRAEKDMQVGHYYMNKGDIDAAIDRFQDAIEAKPGFATPFLYLGEAQEKKGQKRSALKSYTRYLELYPHAEDGAKIRKKIDKLYKEVDKNKK